MFARFMLKARCETFSAREDSLSIMCLMTDGMLSRAGSLLQGIGATDATFGNEAFMTKVR